MLYSAATVKMADVIEYTIRYHTVTTVALVVSLVHGIAWIFQRMPSQNKHEVKRRN